jgi:O-antigen ligase
VRNTAAQVEFKKKQRKWQNAAVVSVDQAQPIWQPNGVWVILAVTAQSLFFPFFLGRPGFLVSALVTAVSAVVLANRVLQLNLPGRRLFGLMLLTVTFMNVDAITSAPELASLGRLSWFLSISFALYLLSLRKEILDQVGRQPLLLLFALFTLMMIIWSIFAGQFSTVLQRQSFFLFVVLIAAEFLLKDKRTGLALLYALVLAALSATMMLVLEYNLPDYLGLSSTIERGGSRSAALYINANMAAYAISFAAIILGLLTKLGFPRHWGLLIFLVIAMGMLLTFSRKGAPWLIFSIVGLSTALLAQHQQTKWRLSLSVSLATLTTIMFGYFLLNSQLLNQLDSRRGELNRLREIGSLMSGNTESYIDVFESSGRAVLSAASWAAIQRDPWLGYGPIAPEISRNAAEFQPHNVVLLIWVEYGLFNLLLFVGILLIALARILQAEFYMRIYGLLFMAHLVVMMVGAHTLLNNRVGAIPLALALVFTQIPLLVQKHSVETRK